MLNQSRFMTFAGLPALLMLALPILAFGQAVTFTPSADIVVGSLPSEVALGDFNGDGRLDIVTSNSGGNNITLLLGNGFGGFSPAPSSPFAVGGGPVGLAVGDFNGDNKLDIAVANNGGDSVSILLGDGAGGFSAASGSPIAVGDSPVSLVAGDFNGDRRLDLAVATVGDNKVGILLGNGNGTFSVAAGSPITVGAGPFGMTLGDVNGDGKLDLVVANTNGGTLSILLGDGAGGFANAPGSPMTAGLAPISVAIGDFNGDGKADLAVANPDSTSVSIWIGNGVGGYTLAPGSPVTAAGTAAWVEARDFNGDGKLDIVLASETAPGVEVFLGNGNGTLQAPISFVTGTQPVSVKVGDFNGDSKPDFAALNFFTTDVSIYLNTTSTIQVNCATSLLQPVVHAAYPGQTIVVTGTCNENILVRNEKQRLAIDGSGAGVGTRATINGNVNAPVFIVRGKGTLIQNLNVTGGGAGVHVNRGTNAVLHNNVIQNSAGNGVIVDELAFAVLTINQIQNNAGAGVMVSENSTARIGFNADSETAASLNVIQTNGAGGIVVSNGASARIVGNTISGNTGDGIQVVRDSHADISNNSISANSGDGIEVGENSTVQLGEDSGATMFDLPNSTSGNNTGVGIRCTSGGLADGKIGTLSGAGGAKSFTGGCIDSLN